MTNIDAFATARARARRHAQIVWQDRAGQFHVARQSRESLKRALLAVGTKGKFTQISTKRGFGFVVDWGIGLIMMRNARFGY